VQIRVGLAIFVWLVAAAGATTHVPAPFRYEALGVRDGCFVDSVAFYDDWRRQHGTDAWVRLLQWGAREEEEIVAGHAVAVFEHRGELWAYDINFGFLRLSVPVTAKDEVGVVAAPLLERYQRFETRHPTFRHDFPQQPGLDSAQASLAGTVPGGAEVVRVAERLAVARPVRVVVYDYPSGGETLTGAACLFLFHGRLCVYVPGHGTVPFRARALSVDNLRQAQELLRRIHPGAVVRTGGA